MYLLIHILPLQVLTVHIHLHSNMYLLIRHSDFNKQYLSIDLHSNMYLLIPAWRGALFFVCTFTFQHVSINSKYEVNRYALTVHLHSNMYLLIPAAACTFISARKSFTFQHVSINSLILLIIIKLIIFIYIPTCIY